MNRKGLRKIMYGHATDGVIYWGYFHGWYPKLSWIENDKEGIITVAVIENEEGIISDWPLHRSVFKFMD